METVNDDLNEMENELIGATLARKPAAAAGKRAAEAAADGAAKIKKGKPNTAGAPYLMERPAAIVVKKPGAQLAVVMKKPGAQPVDVVDMKDVFNGIKEAVANGCSRGSATSRAYDTAIRRNASVDFACGHYALAAQMWHDAQ